VEVKNVTLLDGGCLRFPDAVSERARKHLDLLLAATQAGLRGVILFAANRPEGDRVGPAWGVDPRYAHRLLEVVAAGVQVLAVRLVHTPQGIQVGDLLPVDLRAHGPGTEGMAGSAGSVVPRDQ
jgi:sugar fermentation stimulation protein A